MRCRGPLAVAALTASLAFTSTTVASAGDESAETPSSPAEAAGGEYVVAFEAGNEAAAVEAVEAAGGVVVDVEEVVGMALVETESASFEAEVSAEGAIEGVAENQSIGADRQGMAPVTARERLTVVDTAGTSAAAGPAATSGRRRWWSAEPLEHLQWDMAMIGATLDGAHRTATGRGVTVGIIDTGVDASHPDIAPNFSWWLSRNFTTDMPDIDGECDTPSCVDPAWVDEGGHGTHVAGTVAAARNGVGVTGVAPRATIVNVRAGQDSGYFFFWETLKALIYSANVRLDVVNMSFYTDPWLYNCESRADYISGAVTEEQLAEQALIRRGLIAALEYAHRRGVTLVAAAGNGFTNLALPERTDTTSPDYPPRTNTTRVVTNNCLDLPSEGPHVISVSSVGPSTTKADYSNYGNPNVEVSAPGGWFRDGFGTPTFRTPGNQILSTYPWDLAIEEGLVDPATNLPVEPNTTGTITDCGSGECAVWTYLQGTSMASPHVAGEAALIVDAHGRSSWLFGKSLDPTRVGQIIERTATDHACPAAGYEDYTDEGRPLVYNAVCDGTTARNGLYGEGIINATAAVARRR